MTRFPRWVLALATSGVLFLVGCSSGQAAQGSPSSNVSVSPEPGRTLTGGSEEVPSNGAVAFSAVYVDNGSDRLVTRQDQRDIYLSLPGQDPRRIVGSYHDGIDQSCPTFSPDGTRLAYLEGRGGPNMVVTALEVVDVDDGGAPTGTPVRVAGDPKGELAGCPQWSPDGKKLAIVEDERGMLIATLDGRSHTVSFGSFHHGYHAGLRVFAWSPDGSTLAVIDAGAVWLVPVDGGEARTVWGPAVATDTPSDRLDPRRLAPCDRLGRWARDELLRRTSSVPRDHRHGGRLANRPADGRGRQR